MNLSHIAQPGRQADRYLAPIGSILHFYPVGLALDFKSL